MLSAKYKKCVDCGRRLSDVERAFLCEQFRTLAWAQGFVQQFGNPGALGALDGIELISRMEGKDPEHHVYCKDCFRKLKKQGWLSRKRECKLCSKQVS